MGSSLPSSPDPLVSKSNDRRTFRYYHEPYRHGEGHSAYLEADVRGEERSRPNGRPSAEDYQDEKVTLPLSPSDIESFRRSSGSDVSSRRGRPLKHDVLALVSSLCHYRLRRSNRTH